MPFSSRHLVLSLVLSLTAPLAQAAELSGDAKAAIPHDVQQLIVVDYRAMQNSPAAMNLKDRTLPPELKRLETSLKTSGLKVDQDADVLAFAAFKAGGEQVHTVGIAQGQFSTRAILVNFVKNKTKPVMLRNNSIYPMGAAGLSVVFLNQTTMIFGDRDAVKASLDARDGVASNIMSNSDFVNEMASVDQKAVWSLLDQKGTQTMMKGVLGEASGLADYDTIKNRMKSARYTMDFENGVKFNLAVVMSRHHDRGNLRRPDEGRRAAQEDQRLATGEDGPGSNHHRFQLGNSLGRLQLLRQPVRQPADLSPLPISG